MQRGSSFNEIVYDRGEVVKYKNGSNSICFGYDGERRLSKVNYGDSLNTGKTLNSYKLKYSSSPKRVELRNANKNVYVCEENSAGTKTTVMYGNLVESEDENAKELVIKDLKLELETEYTDNGLVKKETDALSNETVDYSYTEANELLSYVVKENGIGSA